MSAPPPLSLAVAHTTRRLDALRRRVLFYRRPLAALLAAAAMALALQSVNGPRTVDVWVAARELPAGHVLTDADVRSAPFPYDAVPDAVASQPQGQTLLTGVSAGEPLMASRVEPPQAAVGHPGTVAMPVRLSDEEGAALLQPGDVITLIAVAGDGSGSRVLATDVAVLSVPPPSSGLSATSAPGRVIVVAAPETLVEELAEAGLNSFVTFSW